MQRQGCGGQSRQIPAQRIAADKNSPAREACLLTRRDGWGLGAEAPASEVGSQGEDWGWLREHSMKGASAPQLARREFGKKSGAAEEARDFFLPFCFLVQDERGLTVPLKGAPEMGVSRSYQRGPQRQAWDAKAATAATKKPACKHRSLSTPPLPGTSAACHCQGPMTQGKLPRENPRHTSGCCNVTQASVPAGLPRIRTTPSTPLSEPEPQNNLLL